MRIQANVTYEYRGAGFLALRLPTPRLEVETPKILNRSPLPFVDEAESFTFFGLNCLGLSAVAEVGVVGDSPSFEFRGDPLEDAPES